MGRIVLAERRFETFDGVGDAGEIDIQCVEVSLAWEVPEIRKLTEVAKWAALESVAHGGLNRLAEVG